MHKQHEEVRTLVQALVDAGFKIETCDDGEGEVLFDSVDQITDTVLGVDDCHIHMVAPDREKSRVWVYIVLGNEPGVLVNDHIVHPLLNEVVDKHADTWG